MKTFLKIIGVLLFLFVAVAVAVPFFVDVDQYRPQIEKLVNDRINGKLSLGKLKLSLWGQILVKVDGVKLDDRTGRSLVSVKDAHFHLPFTSVLAGSPALTFKMERPELNVVRSRAGKINLLDLMKGAAVGGKPVLQESTQASSPPKTAPVAESAPSPKTPQKTAPVAKSAPPAAAAAIPALALKARLSVELRSAYLKFIDRANALRNEVKDLNIIVKDISLNRPLRLEIWADLNTTLGKTLKVSGPIRLTSTLKPQFDQAEFKKAQGKLQLNLDKLTISMPGAFTKDQSVVANLQTEISASPSRAELKNVKLAFHNLIVEAQSEVTDLQNAPQFRLNLKSNSFGVGSWRKLLPAAKNLKFKGSARFSVNASGSASALKYGALFRLSKLKIEHEMLKGSPEINVRLNVATNHLKKFLLTLAAPGNDLQVSGSVKNFAKPKANFELTSKSMDLDQLVKFPPPATAQAGWIPVAYAEDPPPDFDAMVAPVRKMAIAQATHAAIGVDLKSIQAMGVRITGLESRISFKNLVVAIEKFKMALWKGRVNLTSSVDLRPRMPSYRFKGKIAGLNMQDAVTSQLQLFKNTVIGLMNASVSGSGRSFNPEPAKKNLDLKGKLRVNQATFTTIDVGKMTTDAINKSLDRISKSVPNLKGKKVRKLPGRSTKYEYLTSDFSMKDGVFVAPNFKGKAQARKGVDISGRTKLNILNYDLDAKWEVVDTYNLTQAADFKVKVAGQDVPRILAKKGQPVRFPVSVGCKMTAPCYSYAEVPQYLSKVALANVSDAAKSRVSKKAKKKVDKALKKAAPKLKKLFKGLKF